MRVVNVIDCQPDDVLRQGRFGHAALDLGAALGAQVIGAAVYDVEQGRTTWPYHWHHGVEEWLYAVSGAPVLREPSGERTLEPGELVVFPAGPPGAHTVSGPGRVVVFSAGARGWGEAFVTVYPDSDKISAAPGILFRRADAIDSCSEDAVAPGGTTWRATTFELRPGEDAGRYRYEWCREEWALVADGAVTLRHPDGEDALRSGDVVCFAGGPDGARQLRNDTSRPARVIVFTSPIDRPMSAFHPDEGTVTIRTADREGLVFRLDDQIEDYWDGEPGAR